MAINLSPEGPKLGSEQTSSPKPVEPQERPQQISDRAKGLLGQFTGWIRGPRPNPDAALQAIATFPPQQRRFDWMMRRNREFVFKRPEVLGAENLRSIPIDRPLIVVTSHFSDADIQTVESELKPRLKEARPNHGLGISLQSNNFKDPAVAPVIKLAGKEHFFEYDVRYDKAAKHLQFLFNPENFKKMKVALQHGTDIITAAHEPLSNIPGSKWELPNKSGLGAAYLAQMADAVILPVALDIQTDKPVGMAADVGGTVKRLLRRQRPNARIIIGKSFTLDKIDEKELELFGNYAAAISRSENTAQRKLSAEESNSGKNTLKQLREQSNMIMGRVAALLPEEKRGRWKDDSSNDTMVG